MDRRRVRRVGGGVSTARVLAANLLGRSDTLVVKARCCSGSAVSRWVNLEDRSALRQNLEIVIPPGWSPRRSFEVRAIFCGPSPALHSMEAVVHRNWTKIWLVGSSPAIDGELAKFEALLNKRLRTLTWKILVTVVPFAGLIVAIIALIRS